MPHETADFTTNHGSPNMVVKYSTLQEFNDSIVIFVKAGLTFEATALTLTIVLTGGW